EGPGAGGMARGQPGLLAAQHRRARRRESRVAEDQLDSAVRKPPHARPFSVLPQSLGMLLEIAQMPVGAERAPAVAVAERVEMLVARERPRLVVQALQEPMEELAHASRLARVRRCGSAKSPMRLRTRPLGNVKGGRRSARAMRLPGRALRCGPRHTDRGSK